ncbi:hypothetical protein OH76DRAFT_1471353 [Lentinus brumalis]|uniref:C3H1-type domain-containing protein n=1 Tax=Lentinus brumalis TaxID=2498619 RepID=A0A371DDR2_9APHY|nr:hypothetical protein OH76DRAFT_1471353 [Polyporus brumalis]
MPSKPFVVVLFPAQFEIFLDVYADQFNLLKEKLDLRHAFNAEDVRRYMNSTVRPHAVIVADSFVTVPSYRDVLIRLVEYARAGGTVIYAGLLSSFSTHSALDAGFEHVWELPWRTGPYHRKTFSLNTSVRGIDTKLVSQKYSMKALLLTDVDLQHAVYLEPPSVRNVKNGPHGTVYETPAAFAPVGQGYFGYIGDVNQEAETTKLLLAMCLRPGSRAPSAPGTGMPPIVSSIPMSAADTPPPALPVHPPRRKVLLVSIQKQDWIDESYSQLYRGLMRNAYVTEVCNAIDAVAALSDPSPPGAVIVTDGAIMEASHSAVLQKLVEYTKNGGILVFGVNFSNFFPQNKAREFFQRWELPWDSGDYYRTTFALNHAGIPSPLSSAALVPSFSMKALHLKNVAPEHAVYYATTNSRVESLVFAPTKITAQQATQTPAAFAPVGEGFLGYVGDVNGEQGSIRLTIEMCGVRIQPGDMGTRHTMGSVTLGPGGNLIDRTTQSEEEVPLTAHHAGSTTSSSAAQATNRPREAEVRARAAVRDRVKQEKTAKADKLKEEGNEFFKQEKWAKAAEKYREAAVLAGPQPIYVSNLAAALLKMEEWEAAESAASRALLHDPRHLKSLYRRALARKARQKYMSAESDLYGVLALDEKNDAALKELSEVQRLIDIDEEIDELDDEEHSLLAEPLDVEVESDSEDASHTGNGTPCKFYNHDGCRYGSSCRFKHAPDLKSVRDELGRNVCLSWLVGECFFGDKCVYAHDKTYLPARGWWTDEERLQQLRENFEEIVHEDPMAVPEGILPEALRPLPWRYDLWVHPSAEEKAKALQPVSSASTAAVASGSRPSRNSQAGQSAQASTSRSGRGSSRSNRAHWASRGGQGGATRRQTGRTATYGGDYGEYDEDDADYWDIDAELEERSMYCGHTRADYEELLCQGIKPWDVLPGSIPFNDL